jgi:hypothetical protein
VGHEAAKRCGVTRFSQLCMGAARHAQQPAYLTPWGKPQAPASSTGTMGIINPFGVDDGSPSMLQIVERHLPRFQLLS